MMSIADNHLAKSEGIGEIPKTWVLTRLKYLATIENSGSWGADVGVLETPARVSTTAHLTAEGEWLIDEMPTRSFSHQEYERYRTKAGDIIVVKASGSATNIITGKAGYIGAETEGIVFSNFLMRIQSNRRFSNSRFLYYFLTSAITRERIEKMVSATTYPNLRVEEYCCHLIPTPPVREQIALATYLDRKTEQITKLIANRRKLIELLREERTAIINKAVTKGINPDAKLKPSGIDWLGDIPEHWHWKSLRYVGQCQNGVSAAADYFGFGFPFVSYGDVYRNIALPTGVEGLANSSDADRENYSVEEGDVFFTRTSETVEEIGISSICLQTIENAVFAGFLIRFRPFEKLLHPSFSKYYFRAEIHRQFFVKEMNLVTRASLSQDLLKKMPIVLPSMEEQNEIGKFLDNKTRDIEKTITKIEKEIELMREYRTALISEVVTGKIKVV